MPELRRELPPHHWPARRTILLATGAVMSLVLGSWLFARVPTHRHVMEVSCPQCPSAAAPATGAAIAPASPPAAAPGTPASPPGSASPKPQPKPTACDCTPLPPGAQHVRFRALPPRTSMSIGQTTTQLGVDLALDRALGCIPERRMGALPRHCTLVAGPTIRVGGAELHTGLYRTSHEWDGMYGVEETVVLLIEAGRELRPIHGIVQWDQDVVDCHTSLLQQRQQSDDLDGDGACELCVESIEEVGEGLFTVMDAERWRPQRRQRSLRAYRFDARSHSLVHAPDLDRRCPKQGYQPFTEHALAGDSVAWRAAVQGGSLTRARPWQDPCGNRHFE